MHLIQSLRQVSCTIFVRDVAICRVITKEFCFTPNSVTHTFFGINVLLAAVDNTDEPKL